MLGRITTEVKVPGLLSQGLLSYIVLLRGYRERGVVVYPSRAGKKNEKRVTEGSLLREKE
jgi:hypothetical protein